MNRIADFGKGVGVGLFIGVPVLVVVLAFGRQEVFAFGYMRELSIVALWVVGLALIGRLKSMKIDKSGIEISFDGGPIPPEQAVPRSGQEGGAQ